MIKNWKNFNESWFSGKKEEPKKSSTLRLMSSTGRPTEEEIEKIKKDVDSLSRKLEPKVDPDFLQEISDRLFGPDSDAYVEKLKEINPQFRKREGRTGREFYDPTSSEKFAEREKEIIKSLKGDK